MKFRIANRNKISLSKNMDIRKYRLTRSSKTKPYAVSLPEEVTAELDEIRVKANINVRALIKDLIIEKLPEIRAAAEVETA